MRVGKTLREIDFEKKQTAFCVRGKFPSVKTEQARSGVNFSCFLSTAHKNILGLEFVSVVPCLSFNVEPK